MSASTPDTSVADTLRAAGITPALAVQLETVLASQDGGSVSPEVVDEDALAQMLICREIAAGNRTYDAVRDQDIADGTPSRDAYSLSRFLRTTFCPAVKPDPNDTTVPPRPPAQPKPPPGDGTRGVFSTRALFDSKYKSVAPAPCITAVGTSIGQYLAYAIKPTVTACVDDDGTGGLWKGHELAVVLLFASPATEPSALAEAQSLLPPDAVRGSRIVGQNASYEAHAGSCISVEYTSSSLSSAVHSVDAEWDSPEKAAVILYSGRQTADGSTGTYDGTVHVAEVGIGGHNIAVDGTVTC